MGLFDEVAADGDLALMARLGTLVRPGGLLVVGVPIGPDLVAYNSGRIYGPLRLPMLLHGWEVVEGMPDGSGDHAAKQPTLAALVLRRFGEGVPP
jgi:hypothetical protein